MNTLNQSNTEKFCQLLKLMDRAEYLKITFGQILLAIEKIGDDISTPIGIATAYSLSLALKQFDETLQDPEMCFLVIERSDSGQFYSSEVQVIPFMFQNLRLEILQESIEFNGQIMGSVDIKMQAEHTQLANMWLNSVKMRGFSNLYGNSET